MKFVGSKNEYRFPERATMETLEARLRSDEGMVCRYGDYVLAAAYFWAGGYVAAIYRFVELPESTGLGECECMLSLCEKSPGAFADGGHALAWALAGVNRKEN